MFRSNQNISYKNPELIRQNVITEIISKLILFLIIVSYFELYKFSLIPFSIRYILHIVVPVIMIVFIIINIIYTPATRTKMHFSSFILILIISTIPSYFIAFYFHHQSILMSLLANGTLLFYLLYYYVHFYKISIKFILRLLIGLGLFSVLLYYIQLFLYPKLILDITIIEDRGTIRLFVAGMLCTQLAYFYFLNKFLTKNKIFDLVLSLLCLSIFILQGTRQLIFALFFLTIVYLLISKRIQSRVIIIVLFLISSILLFFIFREIFVELTRVSTTQARNLSGGVRLNAAEFFLTTFMPDTLAYLFGNSPDAPGTKYSMEMTLYSMKYGFYVSDLGLLGDYIKYGIIFIITGILFLIKAIRFKISSKYTYLKYYIASQCFTLITGYGILGGVDIIILLILYIFDIDRDKKKK